MRHLLFVFAVVCFMPVAAWADTAGEKAEIHEMAQKTLTRLYKEEPHARDAIARAEGYAVFSSGGINAFFISAAYGSGVAHNNMTGAETFMKMASGGVGLGLGIKDYRLVFVFHTREAYNQFIDSGWDFSGQADAAAKAGTSGDEMSGAADIMPGVSVYQLTESGLALQVTLQGTKYWKDGDLN
ncbi:MAG: lipid-binding SYLF domain-containing protein [Rhodospirillales bacterium]|nr:lipid-binding SYLF domain-containing protein [Rhodospirillales bacterium]